MDKVTELREKLQSLIGDIVRQMPPDAYGDPDGTIPPVIDSLIAAAREEGAEQERERIRRMQLCGYRVQVSQFPDDERRHCRVETDVYGVAYTLVPASVLAPKEKP